MQAGVGDMLLIASRIASTCMLMPFILMPSLSHHDAIPSRVLRLLQPHVCDSDWRLMCLKLQLVLQLVVVVLFVLRICFALAMYHSLVLGRTNAIHPRNVTISRQRQHRHTHTHTHTPNIPTLRWP